MNTEIQEQAAKLAARSYRPVIKTEIVAGELFYIGTHTEFPGVISSERTEAECLEVLAEMREGVIGDWLEAGVPIPEPEDQASA